MIEDYTRGHVAGRVTGRKHGNAADSVEQLYDRVISVIFDPDVPLRDHGFAAWGWSSQAAGGRILRGIVVGFVSAFHDDVVGALVDTDTGAGIVANDTHPLKIENRVGGGNLDANTLAGDAIEIVRNRIDFRLCNYATASGDYGRTRRCRMRRSYSKHRNQ